MPTAAKFVSALVFAAIAFLAAEVFKPGMPEGTQFGFFSEICAGIGLLCGWLVMGGLVGRGYGPAMTTGVRTSATVVFFALLAFSGVEMFHRAVKMRYHGDPVVAMQDMFAVALSYGRVALTPEVIGTLLIGGMFGGFLAEWSNRTWR